MTARSYMKDYVLKFIDEHFDELENRRFIEGSKSQLLRDVRTNKIHLDWALGELLDQYEFKKMGLIVKREDLEDPDRVLIIYRINDKLIRQSFLNRNYLREPAEYEFVELVKKQIVVELYEPIKSRKNGKEN